MTGLPKLPGIIDAIVRRHPIQIDYQLDARGLACPQPVMELKAMLTTMQVGETVAVAADDPHAMLDFEVFCARTGHMMVHSSVVENTFRAVIRKV